MSLDVMATRSRPLALSLALALAACGGARGPRPVPPGPGPWGERTDLARFQVPLEGAPARGSDRPLVDLVVFSDFECRYCAANEAVLARARERHRDSLRVHFRHLPLPFHRYAERAAQAAEEARVQGGDDAFWAFHDRLFANPGALDEEALLGHAEALGLDAARMRAALADGTHAPRIEADIELADRVGADGTPTLFLNGRAIHGALPYAQLEAILEEEIGFARAALASGVPREALYAVAMRSAHAEATPPPPPPRPRGPRQRLDPTVTYRVPIDGAPMLGPADALVTVVMFSDFQCPYCARAMPTIAALLERHPEDVRLVFRHNPIPAHRDAFDAAQAAHEAFAQGGDAAFWRMHDRLLAHPEALSREELLAHAEAEGLDPARLATALDEGTHEARIDADQALARQLGARVTPSFYVNGRVILGAQPLGVFLDAVDEQLALARARIEAGTPRLEVYGSLMADAAPEAVWTSDEPPSEVTLVVPEGAPRRGAAEPAVVVQMFSDFQCPYCRDVQPTMSRLLEAHPDVQLVFRHYPLPFHRDARPTGIAALEVQRQLGDEAFWRFHDLALEAESLGPEALVDLAARVGADRAEVEAALAEERRAEVIDADIGAVRRAGLRIGTPTFVVGSRLVTGAQPYEVFEEAVRLARSATPD